MLMKLTTGKQNSMKPTKNQKDFKPRNMYPPLKLQSSSLKALKLLQNKFFFLNTKSPLEPKKVDTH